MYDCIIIGTGAAGVSAALTLKARSVNFLWLGNKNLSNKISSAERIKNYPGLSSVSGKELNQAFAAQISESGIEITQARVTGVYATGNAFSVACGSEVYEGKTVILATGVEAVKPIEGEENFLGRGVSYCATCDGFLYRGKKIAVVCTSKGLEEEVEYLASIAAEVYLVALYKQVEVSGENITLIRDMPVAITGGMRAEKLVFKDRELPVDGVFMLKEAVAPSTLVPGLKSENGHVVCDRECVTNLDGLFAAGDCTGRPYQYAKAVGEGNVAAHSVIAYLAKIKREGGEG
ncbi:MAG: NAD(P)/FAD-dependent oxidoreductase [Candidatus Coproplasma sp.]